MSDDDVLIVRRIIPVSRERVFNAWLDPERLAKFMRPGTTTAVTAAVDARVGGAFRIVMSHGPNAVEHTGQYRIIDPPDRLQFTWISVNTDMQPTLVTVLFNETVGGTEVILTHEALPARTLDGHRNGWATILGLLADEETHFRRGV